MTEIAAPKINIPNIFLALILLAGAISFSFITSIQHQTVYTTTVVNTVSKISDIVDNKQTPELGEYQITAAMAQNGVMNSVDTEGLFTITWKIFVIVGIAIVVFILFQTCGLMPSFGGMN